jgi:hypothetical protein
MDRERASARDVEAIEPPGSEAEDEGESERTIPVPPPSGEVTITLANAARALREAFGPITDDDYLPGKTAFRDELCLRFGLSQLEAEELCDELEHAELLRFVRSEDGLGWHVHTEA